MSRDRSFKVFWVTLISFILYFSASVLLEVFNIHLKPFDRINLISDVRMIKNSMDTDYANYDAKKHVIPKVKVLDSSLTKKDFDLYKKPQLITNFRDGNLSALPSFMEKIRQLKNGAKIKIRIAYFGDSMIEADLLTQTFRTLLQQEYGGFGVGYLPITSSVSSFRQTATCSGNGWTDTHFMTKSAKNLYLSGHYFTGNGSASFTDHTIKNPTIPIEKSILYGKTNSKGFYYNGNPVPLYSTEEVNRQVLSKDTSSQMKISSSEAELFGVSFESERGIFVDNFSFRGITGVELNKLDEDFMKAVQHANHYDLIVLQYGVNLLFRPHDTTYDYYTKMMTPVLKKMKNSFKDSEFLMIGSADRAFKYDGVFKTAIGLPHLIETQALMAYENNFAFYNQFETMGGNNSIVRWAEETPSLANKDYVHPNHKGAEVLAKKLFEAFQNDYKKYTTMNK